MAHSLEHFLKSDRLPTLPEVALRVLEIARRPDPDLSALAEVIRLDPAIASRLMRAANSALMGMKSPASSIDVAVARLGSTTVRTVILGLCLANYQDDRVIELRPWFRRLWREMLFQAVAAESLAERQLKRVEAADWFLAGLLQDIGRLAMLTIQGEAYLDTVLDVEDDRTQLQREQDTFGFTHVDVTTGLCRRWNLDSNIINAIAVHHELPQTVEPIRFASAGSLAMGLITSSQCMEYVEEVTGDLRRCRNQIERLLLQVFAFRPDEVFRMLADIDSRVGEFASVFSIDIGSLPPRSEILAEAEEILEQIAQEQQLQLVQNAEHAAAKLKSPDQSQWRDPVTGLFNQNYLREGCSRLHEAAQLKQQPIGVLMIRINGHTDGSAAQGGEAADHCIRHIATLLHRSIRFSDCLVRASEDRFAVILSDVNLDLLVLLADQISQSIMAACKANPDWSERSCSLGVLFHIPSAKPVKVQTLLAEVERAMIDATQQAPGARSVVVIQHGKVVAGSSPAEKPPQPCTASV